MGHFCWIPVTPVTVRVDGNVFDVNLSNLWA